MIRDPTAIKQGSYDFVLFIFRNLILTAWDGKICLRPIKRFQWKNVSLLYFFQKLTKMKIWAVMTRQLSFSDNYLKWIAAGSAGMSGQWEEKGGGGGVWREADLTQERRRRRRRRRKRRRKRRRLRGIRTGKSVQLTRRLVRRRQSACDRRGVGRGLGFNSHQAWLLSIFDQPMCPRGFLGIFLDLSVPCFCYLWIPGKAVCWQVGDWRRWVSGDSAGQGGPCSQGRHLQVEVHLVQVHLVCSPGEGGSTGQGGKAHVAQGHQMHAGPCAGKG